MERIPGCKGVKVTLDDGSTRSYRFSKHQNRSRFAHMLRFDGLTAKQRRDVLAQYDAYFA